jgi:RNA recognition motif-containing protein
VAVYDALAQKEHPVNISVGNLAFTVTEQDLRELFVPYGVVDRINLITEERDTQDESCSTVRVRRAYEC